MAKGGRREGAGRKKGTPNRSSMELRDQLAASGETPLEFLTKLYREPEPTKREEESILAFIERHRQWNSNRVEAGKAAAPFYHSKLSTVEHKGENGGPLVSRVELVFVKGNEPVPTRQ